MARDVTMTDTMGEWCPIHTEEVTGSIPVSPTAERPGQRLKTSPTTRPFVVAGKVAGAFPEQYRQHRSGAGRSRPAERSGPEPSGPLVPPTTRSP